MYQIASKRPSTWLIVIAHLAGRRSKPRARTRRTVQPLHELTPHLQRDLGLRDTDWREHRTR